MDSALKVLIVEDDADQANLLRKCLADSDKRYEVETVSTGKRCLEKVREQQYEAVVLDYQLLDESGLEVLGKMSECGVDTPVVVVSGHGSEQIAVDALKKGAADYVVKDNRILSVLPTAVHRSIETHKLEERLRASEKKYQTLFESAGDAILILAPDTFEVVEANAMSEEIFSRPVSELTGQPFLDIFPDDQREAVASVLRRVHADGGYNSDNLVFGAPDGGQLPLELNAKMIDLSTRRILCNVRNIAEKQHLQSLILSSKRRLQSTFDGITDVICQVNPDLEVVMANKRFSRMANCEPDEVIGRPYYELLCGRDSACDECPVVRTLRTLTSAFIERTHDGQVFEIWSYPILDVDGGLDSVAIYSKDVTEKKKLEKTLVQSEKLASIGLLASGIAHELRNPLNVIETARYYIAEFLAANDPEVAEKLDIIHKNVLRSSKIINNLLEFSRQSPHARESISLKALVENTMALIKKELEAKNIEFTQTGLGQISVCFSLDSLKQVLLNLIINAVHAMEAGGTLTISAERSEPGWVELKVRDTGSGIEQENLSQLFSPFFTTKHTGEGTGLGLYITHMIIERNGGRINVESEVGVGSTFSVVLPESEVNTDC